jgi:predicted membrane protein
MTVDLSYRRLAHRGRGMASRVRLGFFFFNFLILYIYNFYLFKIGVFSIFLASKIWQKIKIKAFNKIYLNLQLPCLAKFGDIKI